MTENEAIPPFVTYTLKSVRNPVGQGATAPEYGEIAAIIKQDNSESRAQVYSEYVASRLAALLGIQTATGVLVTHSRGLRYASLLISEVGFTLTDIDHPQAEEVAERYPIETAKLAVFDVWIGNMDRAGNLRANIDESTENLLVGLDHGCSLLSIADSNDSALRLLESLDWPATHIFEGLVSRYFVEPVVQRIRRLSDDAIQEACLMGNTVGSVMLTDQAMLADVLIKRRDRLEEMVDRILKLD
ncbi:MAG: hypothetical protein IPI97_14385 [Nitrosomonas sp.]|nr:hypothetical protein [Nitrosomonas sp.]